MSTSPLDIYTLRARYTSPDNKCKPDIIRKMDPIAIAYDVTCLVSEVETLRSDKAKLVAELQTTQIGWMRPDQPKSQLSGDT